MKEYIILFLEICEIQYFIISFCAIFNIKCVQKFMQKHRRIAILSCIMTVVGLIYMLYRLVTGQIF